MERKKARLIAIAYRRIGYQAVNVGSDDLSAGIKFLRELEREKDKVPDFFYFSQHLLSE